MGVIIAVIVIIAILALITIVDIYNETKHTRKGTLQGYRKNKTIVILFVLWLIIQPIKILIDMSKSK